MQNELIMRARLRVQDFASGKNFSFNQCHNKEFCVVSRESYFIKAIENFFPVFDSYANPRLSCLYQAMQTQKTISIALI